MIIFRKEKLGFIQIFLHKYVDTQRSNKKLASLEAMLVPNHNPASDY